MVKQKWQGKNGKAKWQSRIGKTKKIIKYSKIFKKSATYTKRQTI
jgi:hypothetical protein